MYPPCLVGWLAGWLVDSPLLSPLFTGQAGGAGSDVLQYEAREVARFLALSDQRLFAAITPRECVGHFPPAPFLWPAARRHEH